MNARGSCAGVQHDEISSVVVGETGKAAARSPPTSPPPQKTQPPPPRFGFNVGMGMVDGLWAGGTEAATDFALITYQIRLLGYNAVRLPFIWKDLDMPPKVLDKDCDPVTVDFIKKRTISPHVMKKYQHKPLPGNVSPMKKKQEGYCNQYLPQDSNYHRLLFTAQSLVAQGIYVVLDYQPMVGLGSDCRFETSRSLGAWGGQWWSKSGVSIRTGA